jgi:hypothetical protein
MKYEFNAIADEEVPRAIDPLYQHLVTTYAGQTNKTASLGRAIPEDLLDLRPQEKLNTGPATLVHQIRSERRFLAQFISIDEPPVEGLLLRGERPSVEAYPGSEGGVAASACAK